MSAKFSLPEGWRPLRRGGKGAALIITLNMIVIMLLTLMAFFSRSMFQRGIAKSSSAIAVEDIFAAGAVEVIISDLVQEISDGSNLTNFITGTGTNISTNTLYLPSSRSTMLPALAGSSGGAGLENLVKRSASGVPFYTGSAYYQEGQTRASPSSSSASSLNGRTISSARWNKALLIARANTNSSYDVTPIGAFIPPDWILVSRAGGNPTSWSDSLRWSATNNSTVIGRYAYAIYDEGGILDANVAGFPTALSNSPSAIPSRKSGASFADLTQIGLSTNQINAMVGWRNHVSGAASGSFPSYSFADNGTNYAAAVLAVTNGFLKNYNTNVSGTNPSVSPRTDHLFTTRQQLISFLSVAGTNNIASALNALRYLGTYSRDLNQPSFMPNPQRPTILGIGSGGNDSAGNDDLINPFLLSTCVSFNYTRNDGARSIVGDPLVRKRFPLNYLSWVTWEGPSATASVSTKAALASSGVPMTTLQAGTAGNIQKYFGLTWNTNGSWSYRSGTNSPIKTLAQVTLLGRDPDFFELLKAGLTAGSLGKAYAAPGSSTSTPEGFNQTKDNSLDAQILQIGANIIDQFDPDSYPSRIQFNDGALFGGSTQEYRGVEDLPYLYRVREGKIMTADSSPSVSLLPKVGGTLTNAGSAVVLLEPEIWNPHLPATNSTNRPTSYRLIAQTVNPVTRSPVSYTIGAQWLPQSGSTTLTWQSNATTGLDALMTFNIPSGRVDLFREPTLLIKQGVPAGSSLSGPGIYTSIYPAAQYASNGVSDNLQYTGIPMGIIPMAFATNIPAGGIDSGVPSSSTNGILPVGWINYLSSGTAGVSAPCVLYQMQYQDTNSLWVTYDEKFAAAPNSSSGYGLPSTGTNTAASLFQFNVNKSFYRDSNSAWAKNAIGGEACVVASDPRSSRFGMLPGGSQGSNDPSASFPLGASPGGYTTNAAPLYAGGWAVPVGTSVGSAGMKSAAAVNAVLTQRPDCYGGFLISMNTGPTAAGWYPSGASNKLRPGLLAQNNPNVNMTQSDRFIGDPQTLASYPSQFFADPDGVVRRGMGAYIPATGGNPANPPFTGNPSGLPLTPAFSWDASGIATPIVTGANANEVYGRPVILNRPFRCVAELGEVFSGTPWRNLDFTVPESGSAALLDIFCVSDTSDTKSLVAGRVNLNTRQVPVLTAILAGAYKDEFNPLNSAVGGTVSASLASNVATALVNRTGRGNTTPAGPLLNISDLAGSWNSQVSTTLGSLINGSASYCGFSDDATSSGVNDLSAVLATSGTDSEIRVERFREATVRGLSSCGQTRVWNLMIDMIVQTGRYPTMANSFDQFQIEGELRYWVHLSIDRFSGQVLDKQIEVVKE